MTVHLVKEAIGFLRALSSEGQGDAGRGRAPTMNGRASLRTRCESVESDIDSSRDLLNLDGRRHTRCESTASDIDELIPNEGNSTGGKKRLSRVPPKAKRWSLIRSSPSMHQLKVVKAFASNRASKGDEHGYDREGAAEPYYAEGGGTCSPPLSPPSPTPPPAAELSAGPAQQESAGVACSRPTRRVTISAQVDAQQESAGVASSRPTHRASISDQVRVKSTRWQSRAAPAQQDGVELSSLPVGQQPKPSQDGVFWRGMKNVKVGSDFLEHGGTELAPMSTTTNLTVALEYCACPKPLLFRLHATNFMQHGADLAFLSCFPGEEEVLFPPLVRV